MRTVSNLRITRVLLLDIARTIACLVLVLFLITGSAEGASKTTQEARDAVRGWLKTSPRPLGMPLGRQVKQVDTFRDEQGRPIYYVVYLQPQGFVIAAADDMVNPIIGFVRSGVYEPSLDNPLGALVTNDLKGRMASAWELQATMAGPREEPLPVRAAGRWRKAQVSLQKWSRLLELADERLGQEPGLLMGLSYIDDVRVSPLVQSRWSQSDVSGQACYNYYTPPYEAGNADNYVCGCVATMMAQLMRYYQHPDTGVGTPCFFIGVDGEQEMRCLRGGDGLGGAYDWGLMKLDPKYGATQAERQAIGAICHDAGVAAHMGYSEGESGTFFDDASDALVNVFLYSNSIHGGPYRGADDIGAVLNDMANTNLDAGYPTLLAIYKTGGGHAVVCDGYGYNAETLYHHLNMGWAGHDDAWYNLPTIEGDQADYHTVSVCIYNVFVTGSGEIISGRVTRKNGTPIEGVTITIADTDTEGETYKDETTTNNKGIYSFVHVPSHTRLTVSASKDTLTFPDRIVVTGTSSDYQTITGNRWGVDFQVPPEERVYNVTQDLWYDDIQPAIEEAAEDDEIIAQKDNIYYGNIEFGDVPVTLRSGDVSNPDDPSVYPESTFIGHSWGGPVVSLGPAEEQDLEDPNVIPFVLDGFSITKGVSNFGGGVYCEEVFAIVRNCDIVNNQALNLDGFSGDGGGVYIQASAIQASAVQFINCRIMNNYSEWAGGGVLCTEVIDGDFEEQTGTMFVNCLIVNNQTLGYGGAMYLDESAPVITLSTIVDNAGYFDPAVHDPLLDLNGYGGIYAVDSDPSINNSILWNNGDDLYECSATYSCIEDNDDGEGNIDDNPLFVTGPLSDYYLSQPPDQLNESPCVNAGLDTIREYVDYDLGQVTTSTTNAADVVVVDMGYHYNYYIGPPILYELRIIVTGPGTTHPAPEPDSHSYPMWTQVQVTAMPEPDYRVQQWVGTDESSWDLINHVTMSSDKTVECYFELDIPTIRNVPGDYTNIQNAIDDCRDGDTILVATGLYHTSWGYEIGNKAITISSTNPDDPWVVANTVIEQEVGPDGSGGSAFSFLAVGPATILNGFTIRGFNMGAPDGLDGDADPYYDAYPGSSIIGGAIICTSASPTIKNCIITDCSITAGSGGTGAAGDDDHIDGGHGGWPGSAYGGGMYCGGGSNPNVINCTFNNCGAIGGNGGDGGDGNDDPDDILDGRGGRGGGWYYSLPPDTPYEFSHTDYYTKYSGRGGAVYVDGTSSPIFTDCTFTNNNTDSGLCGICGINGWLPNLRDEPSINWNIDNFGGAVYIGGGSDAQFIGCLFSNNTASTEIVEDYYDAYVSYGGGVCYEESAMPTFTDCTFVGNEATVGGGMFFWEQSNPTITDCNFINNIAYHGGGIFTAESFGTIQGCTISGNQATTSFAPPGVEGIYGQGAGVFYTGGPGMFEHCLITGNTADMSGGGIYFGGTEAEPITPTLYNCLVTDNVAGRDGGGISCDWFSEPSIINCTISGNAATGEPPFGAGYGGGLYCSYESNTNLINSILWGNTGTGQSIALATEYDPDPRPATLTVQYCDVQGGQQAVWVEQGCTLNWLEGNIDADPLFVDGYYLSQIAARQAEDSPCVNAGSDTAQDVGLYRHSTRTDGAPDAGTVDMGYHYEMLRLLSCDFDFDWDVDLADLKVLLSYWLRDDCYSLDWCEGTDMDSDTKVDFADYVICAGQYSPSDEASPQPTPSEWAIEPHEISSSAVSMTATTATDENAVEYYFKCTQGTDQGGDNSGWQDDPNYVDTGLSVSVTYCYKVKTRDKSWRQNETGWSTEQCATPADIFPPEPDPSTWDIEPYETSAFTISMTATTATDPSGSVWYYFECTSGDCDDSGWQASPTYEDEVYTDEATYCYTVKARDMDENETTPSEESCVWVDHRAPQPGPTWQVAPNATSPFSVAMSANAATDPSGVQYYFECTTGGGHDSGWQDDPNYVDTGLPESTTYTYRVRTRDTHNNISEYSASASAATPADLQVPSPDPSTWAVEPRGVPGLSDSITMTASTATDPSGVEYYFDCTSPGGHDSSWQNDPTYVDTGLSVGTTYCYTVKTRDKSVNQNETGQSEERCAFIDITPPTPDPSEWQTPPYQYEDGGKYYHQMVAVTASDISGVEYWFYCIGGGGSTAWQNSQVYEVEVPGPDLVWSYKVKARDKSSNHNETAYSDWGTITNPLP